MQARLHRGRGPLRRLRHRVSALLLPAALALASCGGGSEAAPPVETAPAETAPTETTAETAPADTAPSVETLRALAAGDREMIDPSRGVIVIGYANDTSEEDPAGDAQGLVRTATRACGAELDAALERLAGDLTMRFDDPAWAPLVRCEGSVCIFPALGEYDRTGELTFEDGALVSVIRIEGGPVTDDFIAEGRAWAAARLAELDVPGGGCAD